MPELISYDYAVVRVVPRPDREEFLNVGIVLFARTAGILDCRISLHERRLEALLPPGAEPPDIAEIRAHLGSFERICVGGEDAGPIGRLSQSERFHWLVAPRSTVIQVSPVHPGLSEDPARELERLHARLVGPGRDPDAA